VVLNPERSSVGIRTNVSVLSGMFVSGRRF
jgi:hypothetical protein